MTTILLVGASDTGRAPMAAALLRRLIDQHSLPWLVESAGVLGHEGAPAQIEARDTMALLGLDLADHTARALTEHLVAGAALLLALDAGIARVLRERFPTGRVVALGELAGVHRDIPDPFRMQIGAWMTYARELERLLEHALPRLRELLPHDRPSDLPAPPAGPAEPGAASQAGVVQRLTRLLLVAGDFPGVVDWRAASAQIERDLQMAVREPGDLAVAYLGLLRAALAMSHTPPSPGQLAALAGAIARLERPLRRQDVDELAALIPRWSQV